MFNRITYNPKILGGKPIIRDTRISVEFILELLASGMNAQDVVLEYPQIRMEDILACLQHATKMVKREELVFSETL